MRASVGAPVAWRGMATVVRNAADGVMRAAFPSSMCVGIRLVDASEMAELLATFRHTSGVTDVLSFCGDTPEYAGDVALCVDVARTQAAALGHSIETELVVLCVHALMHLWGLDHALGHAQAVMQAEAEMGLLSMLGVPVEAALSRRGFS